MLTCPSADLLAKQREIASLQVMIACHNAALAKRDDKIDRLGAALNAAEQRMRRLKRPPTWRELGAAFAAGAVAGASVLAVLVG